MPEPHRLVGVAGADAASRRADRELAEAALARLVDREMPRHDQVRVARDVDLVGGVAAPLELVELGDQHLRVDDAAVADHARLAADDSARQRADLVRLVADHDRVAGVRPALVAADDVGVLGEQVDDLALAFVPPLRADDDGGRHGRQYAAGSRGRLGAGCERHEGPGSAMAALVARPGTPLSGAASGAADTAASSPNSVELCGGALAVVVASVDVDFRASRRSRLPWGRRLGRPALATRGSSSRSPAGAAARAG